MVAHTKLVGISHIMVDIEFGFNHYMADTEFGIDHNR